MQVSTESKTSMGFRNVLLLLSGKVYNQHDLQLIWSDFLAELGENKRSQAIQIALDFIRWTNRPGTHFRHDLFSLLSKADHGNKLRISESFPVESLCFISWYKGEKSNTFSSVIKNLTENQDEAVYGDA